MATKIITPAGIEPSTNSAQPAGFNALIFAKSKMGKTVLSSTIANHPGVTKALHLDFDGSRFSIPPIENLDSIEIPSGHAGWERFMEIFNWICSGDHGYNTFIVDTISSMAECGLQDVTKRNFLKTRSRSEEERVAFPGMGDYAINNRRTISTIRSLRDLSLLRGWNVVFVCHEKEYKDKTTGALSNVPALSGAAGETVPGIPSMVARLTKKSGQRVLQVGPTYGEILDYRRDPTVARKLPELIRVKDLTNPNSEGMDLADIWQAILDERKSSD